MADKKVDLRLDRRQARAAVFAAQGLLSPGRNLVSVLEDNGFVRTLGGIDVYLALKARLPGLRREEVDAAVIEHRAQVLPAARGCIYLLARAHAPVALRVADLLSAPREKREHEKAGIRPGEVDEIAAAARELLRAKGPLTTNAIRAGLPKDMVRGLGEAGKKLGISSPLPAALRRLEFQGDIERTLEDGRLDSERYLWRATARNLFAGADVPEDPAALFARFAEIFFRAAGLASRKSFADWAGFAQKDAQAAIEKLGLLAIEVEGEKETFHALPSSRENLAADPSEAEAAIAFLPFEDNAQALQSGPAFMTDAEHHGIEVQAWGMGAKKVKLGDAKHAQLRSLLAEGRLAGFWEYDPDGRTIAIGLLSGANGETRRAAEEKAAKLAAFIAEDLGHGRSFSLDTDKDLRERSAYLRTW
jgi:hypothetical protein